MPPKRRAIASGVLSAIFARSRASSDRTLVVAGALCELCVFARRRRHWLAEQRRRRDAATSVTLPVALVPEDDARDAADAPTAPLTSPRRRQSQAAATDVL